MFGGVGIDIDTQQPHGDHDDVPPSRRIKCGCDVGQCVRVPNGDQNVARVRVDLSECDIAGYEQIRGVRGRRPFVGRLAWNDEQPQSASRRSAAIDPPSPVVTMATSASATNPPSANGPIATSRPEITACFSGVVNARGPASRVRRRMTAAVLMISSVPTANAYACATQALPTAENHDDHDGEGAHIERARGRAQARMQGEECRGKQAGAR